MLFEPTVGNILPGGQQWKVDVFGFYQGYPVLYVIKQLDTKLVREKTVKFLFYS